MKRKAPLALWLIADAPRHSRFKFVARKWTYSDSKLKSTSEEMETNDLEEFRSQFQSKGFQILPKMAGMIIETWIEPERELTLLWKSDKNYFIAERPFTFYRNPLDGKQTSNRMLTYGDRNPITISPGPISAEYFHGCYSKL